MALVGLQSYKSSLVLAAQKYHQSGKNNFFIYLHYRLHEGHYFQTRKQFYTKPNLDMMEKFHA